MSTSSSASEMDGHTAGLKSIIGIHYHVCHVTMFPSSASIGSGCSSIHEQDGPTPLGR